MNLFILVDLNCYVPSSKYDMEKQGLGIICKYLKEVVAEVLVYGIV